MRMVGSCIVTTPRVITYCVVACSSSRGLPDSCIASTFFQPDACRTVRNSETDLPERFAFRKLDPTIRKEPVAMKQLPVRGSCSGPSQPSETGTRPTRSRSDSAIFVSSSQEGGEEHGMWLRVRILNSAPPKMLSGANAFEISDIERMNIGAHEPGH